MSAHNFHGGAAHSLGSLDFYELVGEVREGTNGPLSGHDFWSIAKFLFFLRPLDFGT